MNRKEALDALSITPGWHMATAGQGQNACVEINLAVPGVVGVRDALHFRPWPEVQGHVANFSATVPGGERISWCSLPLCPAWTGRTFAVLLAMCTCRCSTFAAQV
jgi:hypothetical protein